jgi:diadenylate cyclase
MHLFATISWIAFLDIALLLAVLIQFLLLVRGTRAAQMLLGGAVVTGLLYLAWRAKLPITSWIVERMLPFALLSLVILFQAEIRDVLARIGRRLAFGGNPSSGDSYDDIVLAANMFSEQKTGALIVLERESGLRTYIESGVPMDAVLTYDLLVTIFRPSAPLHDGAVIIQRDRVAAAACFLPLSMNPVLSNQLGTRHRAAIGITEETDAIAIIVSEETGSISLAQSGKLERNISVDALRERLSTMLRLYVAPTALPTPLTSVDEQASALRRPRED